MKQKELFLLLWLCIFPILNYAQSNYKLEYWFNDDYAKVSSLNFTAVTGEFTELTIPAAHVPFGMNKIHCRVLDADNKPSAVWYSYFTRGYIGTPKTIIEYWYDEDMTKTFRNTVTNSDLTIEFNA